MPSLIDQDAIYSLQHVCATSSDVAIEVARQLNAPSLGTVATGLYLTSIRGRIRVELLEDSDFATMEELYKLLCTLSSVGERSLSTSDTRDSSNFEAPNTLAAFDNENVRGLERHVKTSRGQHLLRTWLVSLHQPSEQIFGHNDALDQLTKCMKRIESFSDTPHRVETGSNAVAHYDYPGAVNDRMYNWLKENSACIGSDNSCPLHNHVIRLRLTTSPMFQNGKILFDFLCLGQTLAQKYWQQMRSRVSKT